MASPGYRQVLARLLPLALAGAGEDADALFLCQEADALLSSARDRVRARQKAAYAANAEQVKKKAKERRLENPSDPAKRRERYQARHDYRVQKGCEYSATRKATGKAAEHRERTREATRAACRTRSSDVTDGYARELLAKNSPVSAKDFPQPLVEVKKLEIKLNRILRDE